MGEQNGKRETTFLDVLSGILGLFLGLLLFVLFFFILNIFHFVQFSKIASFFSPSSKPPIDSYPYSNQSTLCGSIKDKNSFIENVHKQGNTTFGYLHGKIKNFTYTPSGQPAILTLTSLDGVQNHTFNIKLEKKILSNNSSIPLIITPDLQVKQNAMITFTCFPNTQEEFVITRIDVVN